MSAAGTDALRKIIRQFAGIDLPDTASDGKFVSAAVLIIDHAGIDARHLQEEVADQAKYIGITGLGMDHGELVIVVIIATQHCHTGNFQLSQGNIGITEQGYLVLIKIQTLTHIHVHRVRQFGELVGIHIQAVIQRSSQISVFFHGIMHFLQHCPHQGCTASHIGLQTHPLGADDFQWMMVDDSDLLRRDLRHIAGTVLTVHRDQQSVYCIFHLRLVLQRNVQFLHHQHQVGLSDFIPSGIQQPGILSLVPEKTVQPIAGGYGIRIRIIVALDRHMVITQ